MSEYEFHQIIAETRYELGDAFTLAFIDTATDRFGWPVPPSKRKNAVLLLAQIIKSLGLEKCLSKPVIN